MVDYANRDFMTTLNATAQDKGIIDGTDYIHSGIVKVLENAARGNYIVEYVGSTVFRQTAGSSRTRFDFSGNISYMRDGKLTTATPNAVDLTADPNTTYNRYDMIVIQESDGHLAVRIGTAGATPRVADKLTDGDIPVALVEVVAGASSTANDTTRKVQLYGYNKHESSVSIGRTNSAAYTEGLTIQSNAGDIEIEAKESNKDIIFKVNDNGTTRELLRLDSSDMTTVLTSTVDDAAKGPILELRKDRPSTNAANNDFIGEITFTGDDAGENRTEYAKISSRIGDESAGAEDGQLFIRTMVGGSHLYNLKFTSTTTIFNANNDNLDVRIDGDTNDNLFYADAGSESIGIGIAPIANAKLSIEGALALDEISAPTNTADYGQLYTNSDNELHMIDGDGTDQVFLKGGTHTIWVPATAMYATTTDGCSALTQVEQTALRPELKVLDFAAGADDHAQFSIAMPKNWNEGVIQFQAFWTVTGTDTGLVAWGLTAQGVINSGVTNTGFSALTTNTPLAHSGTSNDLMVSAKSGNVTVLNAAADAVTYFMLARDVSAESADAQTGVARLIGIKLFYTINAGNDV
tara:strand:- start:2819 stop:4552 length:1734 start_codon:yes stop_codon:yes gene_type:complete